MAQQYSILVIEDDAAVRNLVATALDLQGYAHREVRNATQGLMELTSGRYDLLILDLGLPDMDGSEVISRLRGWSEMPVVVLSARLEDSDKVAALDAGADDYLTKPFSVEELLARLRVAFRRLRQDADAQARQPSEYVNGELSIDFEAGTASVGGEEVHLTPIEFRLLCLLANNTGKVLTHNFILKEVWGAALASDLPSLRVFMATLRKKIEPDPSNPAYIQTHVGVGYRMMRVGASERED